MHRVIPASSLPLKTGFSLPELLVAMVAASILTLTVSALLVAGFRGWRDDQGFVNLQQDASLAADMVRRAVRGATRTNVTVSAGGSRVDVVRPGRVSAWYASGTDLVYDPDTTAGSDEQRIVAGRLTAFQLTPAVKGVGIQIACSENGETTTLNTFAHWRN